METKNLKEKGRSEQEKSLRKKYAIYYFFLCSGLLLLTYSGFVMASGAYAGVNNLSNMVAFGIGCAIMEVPLALLFKDYLLLREKNYKAMTLLCFMNPNWPR